MEFKLRRVNAEGFQRIAGKLRLLIADNLHGGVPLADQAILRLVDSEVLAECVVDIAVDFRGLNAVEEIFVKLRPDRGCCTKLTLR